MTVTHDDNLQAGMHLAFTAGLSCAGTIASVWKDTERSDRQPRCFRLFRDASAPLVSERPGRKLGPEDNSHISLNIAVCPARNAV
jgi:hypothetical protein